MKLKAGEVVLSPSDLMRFTGCVHAAALDLRLLMGEVLQPAKDGADMALVQGKGNAHERRFLEALRASGAKIVEISTAGKSAAEVQAETLKALRAGPDYIFQAALSDGRWGGFADFLERVPRPSLLGPYSYEIIDTKLKKTPSPQHLMQLSIYAELLQKLQGTAPEYVHIVLGDNRRVSLRLADYSAYTSHLRTRLEMFIATPWQSQADPVAACDLCRWREHCAHQWDVEDNICLVAGIAKSQRNKLRAAGIETLAQLSTRIDPVPKLAAETLEKLRTQAQLQHLRRNGSAPSFKLKTMEEGRGLTRLPRPDLGDIFFDMEGDPYYEGGLEYLFGLFGQSPELSGFKPFWAHNRDAERRATEDVLRYFAAHFRKYPDAHIYHYAQYEVTALKKLASWHGVGEAALDQLLRESRFVDLYNVVHQGLFASEPGYSIKNLEAFYRPARAEAIKSGMESVVSYEEWRESQDPQTLEDIRAYNEIDCRSTMELRDWLISSVRPAELNWWQGNITDEKAAEQEAKTAAAEAERAGLRVKMEAAAGFLGREFAEMLFELTWFHQREDKPQWWAMFDRADRDSEELIDDLESLAALEACGPAKPEAKSLIQKYRYPDQETKLREGSNVKRKDNLRSVSLTEVDLSARIASVKFGPKAGDIPQRLDLIPAGPIDNKVLRSAVLRVAESVFAGSKNYAALADLLQKNAPRLVPSIAGGALLQPGEDVVGGATRVIELLDRSCLAIQGPPGTGKTYVSSQAILALIKKGKRVAVTSNSHKAVDNLLTAVADRARETGYALRAVKKTSVAKNSSTIGDPLILEVSDAKDASLTSYPLVGGTAWLFARDEHDQAFDYLFVDEAGQVSLANILATGCAAKNIVLVGDPMQLGQPIQGSHPGDTGMSCLEYLLAGHATVPPERGIFLPVSRRMHPSVCKYISEVVYEGKLQSDAGAGQQALSIADNGNTRNPTGLRFVGIEHEGNSQSSEGEATALAAMWHGLLGQRFRSRDGVERELSARDILVVSPYNAQVNLITAKLPPGARVGTVDRFQGQEAPVCLISMATSSADEMPRNIEFLFSVNRLNVAVSRAQVLAAVFASPRLLEVPCRTVEQMRLVNALCAVKAYAEGDRI
jgi:predicted RecB family nuclease